MLKNVNDLLWLVATFLIFIFGIYFSFKIKFKQLNFKNIFRALRKKTNSASVTPIQTLTMNLAARIGVGSISGIALAIYLGGVGTVFWMWLTGLVASSTTFFESTLAVMFRRKDNTGEYISGPSHYIEKGLNKKILAKIYSLIIVFTFIVGFLPIQSNTIAVGINDISNLPKIIIGLIVSLLVGVVIFKGIKRIAKVTEKLVPFMGILYIIISLIIIGMNIELIPVLFINIFKSAFNFKACGMGIFATLLIGMQRGIFSNEAGIGTGAIGAGVSDCHNPEDQGHIQSLGVYIDTFIVGTISALVIMCCDFSSLNIMDANGIEIANFAFSSFIGNFGSIALMVIITLFAYASIITGYYYGEASIKYLFPTLQKVKIFKIAVVLLLIFGSIFSSTVIWQLVDIFIAILAIINIYALFLLKEKVLKKE